MSKLGQKAGISSLLLLLLLLGHQTYEQLTRRKANLSNENTGLARAALTTTTVILELNWYSGSLRQQFSTLLHLLDTALLSAAEEPNRFLKSNG